MENPEAASTALDWAKRGLDFADALHLGAAQGHDGFVTFDKALARTVRRLGVAAVREP